MNNGKGQDKKLFIVRKYILANNAKDAIRIEKNFQVEDVYLDPDWIKKPVGFNKEE